ncbi:PAS domain-containing protein [Phenylobacterium sp.]|uniref:PAS domain-containing sensor histidine kinase n=1 Tax=Phenylobacterium sp. TaxID=1871053 RepID=UPI0028967830|nr:PAS domain-containing protein [Phenylobacterium sp.]
MALVQTGASAAETRRVSGHAGLALALAEHHKTLSTLISANPAFRKWAGIADGEAGGGRLDAVFCPDDAARIQSLIERCVRGGRVGRIDHVLRSDDRPEGRRIWAYPVEWTVGDAEQVILSIASGSRSHHLTNHSETLFDHLGPISSGMLYVYDVVQRRTRYLHPELAESLGLSPTGAGLAEVQARVHPDDRPIFERHIAEMAGLGNFEVAEAQARMRALDGSWLVLQSRVRVFSRASDGSVRRVIGVASDVTAMVAQAEALAKARDDIDRAELDERRRIGRELHDSTAQHLVAIGLSLAALERRMAFDEGHQAILQDIRSSIAAAHREIRAFSFMLHPPREGPHDLLERLRVFAEGFGRRASLRISVEVAGKPQQTSNAMETALFRIFQEALMNVHRHTTARTVRAVLGYVGGEISLLVEDDGGKPPHGRLPTADDETGVGISGMRGRLIELGGRLDLEPGAGGLRLRAQVPLQSDPRKASIRVGGYIQHLIAPEERSFAPRRLGVEARSAPPRLA